MRRLGDVTVPDVAIEEGTSLKKMRGKAKKEVFRVIELDKVHISFDKGDVNTLGNIETSKDAIINMQDWIDEYGQKWIIHIKDQVRSSVILSKEAKKVFMENYAFLSLYEKQNLLLSLSVDEKKELKEGVSDELKKDIEIETRSLILKVGKTDEGELKSRELYFMGRIKLLKERSEVNSSQLIIGALFGGVVGFGLSLITQFIIALM